MNKRTIKKLQKEAGAEAFGKRVREAREDAGYTQAGLAEAIGSHQATLCNIENGRSRHTHKLIELSAELGVNPAWLQFGDQVAPREFRQ